VSGSVVGTNGLRTSTPLLRVEAQALGAKAFVPVPDYDGCSEWGGFEESQVAYLERHNRAGQARLVPRVSHDAKEGTHAAILEPGTTVLPPILSTATAPHRFTCFLKADQPASVTVQVTGERKTTEVGATWTEIHLDHTPVNELMGGIPATVTIPDGVQVLLDAVSFHPRS
jgi:hypothetical protein